MSDMWVAVTAEYDGATFSHRAQSPKVTKKYRALWAYNRLLDEAGDCVRNGFAGWLPPQDVSESQMSLSTYEKLCAIEKMIAVRSNDEDTIQAIRTVLAR